MAIIRSGQLLGVVIHHSAVQPGAENITALKQRASSYNKTHSTKSWAEKTKTNSTYPYLAYHDMMSRDGDILHTQEYSNVMYHASNFYANSHYIGMCIDGNFDIEQPTAEIKESLARYLARKQKEFKVDIIVRVHKEVADKSAPTGCAGKNIGTHDSGWLKGVIARTNEIIKNNLPTNPISQDTPATPPQPPQQSECEKEVDRLNDLIRGYETTVKTLTDDNRSLGEENKELESEIKSLQSDYDRILQERDRFESDYMNSVKELNEYKDKNNMAVIIKSITDWVVERFDKIYAKIKK